MTSSNATLLNYENDCESEKFDYLVFQNIKTSAYLNLHLTLRHQSNHEIFYFISIYSIRSLQKNFERLCDLLSNLPTLLD